MKFLPKIVISFVLILSLCRLPEALAGTNKEAFPKPVLITTDMALDDWSAILYLLHNKNIKVVGIAVDGAGEAHCDLKSGDIRGATNALGLLSLAGKENEKIPVACGSSKPLKGDRVFPEAWRKEADGLMGLSLPKSSQNVQKINAAQLFSQLLKAAPAKIDVLALGPLTTLGELVKTGTLAIDKINTLTIMGGAVKVPGNLDDPGAPASRNIHAEWNIYIDPYAADLVFQSGLVIQLVSLDGTKDVPVSLDFLKRFEARNKYDGAKFVTNYLNKQINFIKSGRFFFWDPLAAAVVSNPELCSFEDFPLRVVEDGVESGRTKIDPKGKPIRVCTAAKRNTFEKLFVDTFNGGNS